MLNNKFIINNLFTEGGNYEIRKYLKKSDETSINLDSKQKECMFEIFSYKPTDNDKISFKTDFFHEKLSVPHENEIKDKEKELLIIENELSKLKNERRMALELESNIKEYLIEQFQKGANEDILLKAWCGDFLWDIFKENNVLTETTEAYIIVLNSIINEEEIYGGDKDIPLIFSRCSYYAKRTKSFNEEVSLIGRNLSSHFISKGEYSDLSSILKIILQNKLCSKDVLKEIYFEIEENIDKDKDKIFSNENLMEMLVKIIPEKTTELYTMAGIFYECNGDSSEEELHRHSHYRNALKNYKKADLSDKSNEVKEIHMKIEKLESYGILKKSDVGRLQYKIPRPNGKELIEVIRGVSTNIGSEPELLLGVWACYIEKTLSNEIQEMKKSKNRERFSIMDKLEENALNYNRKGRLVKMGKEFELPLVNLKILCSSNADFIDIGLSFLLKEGLMTVDKIIEVIGKGEFYRERDNALIFKGIEAYFREEFVVAGYILSTQIEDILKNVSIKTGNSILKIRGESGKDYCEREKTLGVLIDENKDYLGEDFCLLLKYLLVGQTGINIRNKVAHGMIAEEDLNKSTVGWLVFVVVYLSLSMFKSVCN